MLLLAAGASTLSELLTAYVAIATAGIRFERCRFSGTVDFTAADVSTASFADCTFSDGARLLVDNDTWTGIGDPGAQAGFERALADR